MLFSGGSLIRQCNAVLHEEAHRRDLALFNNCYEARSRQRSGGLGRLQHFLLDLIFCGNDINL